MSNQIDLDRFASTILNDGVLERFMIAIKDESVTFQFDQPILSIFSTFQSFIQTNSFRTFVSNEDLRHTFIHINSCVTIMLKRGIKVESIRSALFAYFFQLAHFYPSVSSIELNDTAFALIGCILACLENFVNVARPTFILDIDFAGRLADSCHEMLARIPAGSPQSALRNESEMIRGVLRVYKSLARLKKHAELPARLTTMMTALNSIIMNPDLHMEMEIVDFLKICYHVIPDKITHVLLGHELQVLKTLLDFFESSCDRISTKDFNIFYSLLKKIKCAGFEDKLLKDKLLNQYGLFKFLFKVKGKDFEELSKDLVEIVDDLTADNVLEIGEESIGRYLINFNNDTTFSKMVVSLKIVATFLRLTFEDDKDESQQMFQFLLKNVIFSFIPIKMANHESMQTFANAFEDLCEILDLLNIQSESFDEKRNSTCMQDSYMILKKGVFKLDLFKIVKRKRCTVLISEMIERHYPELVQMHTLINKIILSTIDEEDIIERIKKIGEDYFTHAVYFGGNNLLHIFAQAAKDKLIFRFVVNTLKIQIDSKNFDGYTALMLCYQSYNIKTMLELIRLNANLSIKQDSLRMYAIEMIVKRGGVTLNKASIFQFLDFNTELSDNKLAISHFINNRKYSLIVSSILSGSDIFNGYFLTTSGSENKYISDLEKNLNREPRFKINFTERNFYDVYDETCQICGIGSRLSFFQKRCEFC